MVVPFQIAELLINDGNIITLVMLLRQDLWSGCAGLVGLDNATWLLWSQFVYVICCKGNAWPYHCHNCEWLWIIVSAMHPYLGSVGGNCSSWQACFWFITDYGNLEHMHISSRPEHAGKLCWALHPWVYYRKVMGIVWTKNNTKSQHNIDFCQGAFRKWSLYGVCVTFQATTWLFT